MLLQKVNRYVFILCWQYLLLLTVTPYVWAQKLPAVELEPVEIIEQRLSAFAIGSKTSVFDSTLIHLEALPDLADIINNYTATAVKSYGSGMLSTISFRGTGPSHTAILWHGINIAYPMLGQSDLSLLSLALSDQLTIQFGTGSPLYGSGALGGTLSLTNKLPKKGTEILFSQWFGSFGTIKNQVRASYASDKFYIQIGTLWDQSANNFSFKNTTKPGTPTEIQQEADYKIFGTSLESGLNIGQYGQLLISGQFFTADRNLQSSMNANRLADNQTDENIRLRTKYLYKKDKLTWNLNYALLHDVIGFNGDKTNASQNVFRAEMEQRINNLVLFNLAADYNNVKIQSPFYANNKAFDNRANIWASFLINPIDRLVLSLNLRQSFNAAYKIPFTPSIGVEYYLIERVKHTLKIKSLAARGFRIPTLNERFWQPGGNQDLVAEDSYSAEIGLAGKSTKGLVYSYEITTYRMWVDNWILWRPTGSFWSPENVKYVDVYGLELVGSLQHRLGQGKMNWLSNYAFTKSINRTGLDQFDRSVDKQLVYVPVHKASLSSITELNSWAVLINLAFTGERYVTADNEASLPAYFLLNFRLSKTFRSGNYSFNGHANINNALNTNYQSVENRAMPGINFLVGITISYYKP
jgi:outer membrane cobalamin receptor